MSEPLTFLMMPESAYGPTNNSIGIGDVLRRRGHRVVFAAEASWEGKLSALGFDEDLVHLAEPSPEATEADPGQFWKDFIRDTAPQFRRTTLEQLGSVIEPIWRELADGAMYCEPHLREIVGRSGADTVVEDNVICFPALITAGVPFVRIMSCNPLEMTGMDVPPAFSGLPSDDPSQWAGFRAEYDRTHRPLWETFNGWVQDQGAPALPDLEFIHESAHANLYVYPAELDYVDRRPLGPAWHRLDSSVRTTDEPYELPDALREGPGRLIYFSLGSLGSADVDLMTRTIDVLAATPHRYVVSKGPLHHDIALAPNMTGAEFLPQTSILPLVDAVITHGGNNTTTEALHHGLPMIVLPLFWDQYDNAQRVHELGYGVRLDPYRYTPDELVSAVERVLTDPTMRGRCAAAGQRIRSVDGVGVAADVLERVAAQARAARR